MNVKCFWLEPAKRVRVSLRRYEGSKCEHPGHGYHDARVYLEDRPARFNAEGYIESEDHPKDDSHWPMRCACGYEFSPEDIKQVFVEEIYSRSDTGEEVTLREAPPGAMWDAWWMGNDSRGPDGKALCVKLPDGLDWLVDGPAYSDGHITNPHGWTRQGTPPSITASPSILTKNYHGHLINGELIPC